MAFETGERAIAAPLVGLVVVNFNGGDLTLHCLESIDALIWPREALRVVLVDNGSTDGVAAIAARRWQYLDVVRSQENLGFAGGCNAGIDRLRGADFIGLVNSDASLAPDWLEELIRGFVAADERTGAMCPKILFEHSFLDIRLRDRDAPVGVPLYRVRGVRVGGQEVQRHAQFPHGFGGPERDEAGEAYRWAFADAVLRVPVRRELPPPETCEIELEAANDRVLRAGGGADVPVAKGRSWCTVRLTGDPYDVINNAGSMIFSGGFGGDRGFQTVEEGQYDQPDEVFAWCGAAVLLSRAYLDDVGNFDERFFLYYEDTDLSWRGRLRGWRYGYAPNAVVRHVHSASSVEWSPLFVFYVERNRLLMLLRNAPAGLTTLAVVRQCAHLALLFGQQVLRPLAHGRRPAFTGWRRRAQSLTSFARLLPVELSERSRIRRRRLVSDDAVLNWMASR